MGKQLITDGGTKFGGVRPSDPQPFSPVLLTVGLALFAPSAATLGLLAAFAPFLPPQTYWRTLLIITLVVATALSITAAVRWLWTTLELPGRGPSDFMPVRWFLHRRATKKVHQLVAQLASRPADERGFHALGALAKALEGRDLYTRAHSGRVSRLAWEMMMKLGFSKEDCEVARVAGLLHDVGKIVIPDSILLKSGPLSPSEFDVMKTHAPFGADLVTPYAKDQVVDAVLHHHERIDGEGYPEGIPADALDVISRLVPVCDTYDTLVTDRPYRPGMSKEKAFTVLREVAGSQLDATLVEALIELETSKTPVGGSALAALLPIGPFLKRMVHAAHTSTAPAAAALAAATVAVAVSVGGTAESPPARPAALPTAPITIEGTIDPGDELDFEEGGIFAAARPRFARLRTGGAPGSGSPQDPGAPPPAGETPRPCRLPIADAEVPQLPLLGGCAVHLLPLP